MIVCKECGFKNSDNDSFCGTCGSFLEWTGEKVAPAPVAAEPDEPKRKLSLYERVSKVIYADLAPQEEPVAAAATPGGPPMPGGAPGGPPRPGGPPGAGG